MTASVTTSPCRTYGHVAGGFISGPRARALCWALYDRTVWRGSPGTCCLLCRRLYDVCVRRAVLVRRIRWVSRTMRIPCGRVESTTRAASCRAPSRAPRVVAQLEYRVENTNESHEVLLGSNSGSTMWLGTCSPTWSRRSSSAFRRLHIVHALMWLEMLPRAASVRSGRTFSGPLSTSTSIFWHIVGLLHIAAGADVAVVGGVAAGCCVALLKGDFRHNNDVHLLEPVDLVYWFHRR